MEVQWRRKRGRPKRRWLDNVKDDIKEKGLSADDVYDRATWRRTYVIVHQPHIKLPTISFHSCRHLPGYFLQENTSAI